MCKLTPNYAFSIFKKKCQWTRNMATCSRSLVAKQDCRPKMWTSLVTSLWQRGKMKDIKELSVPLWQNCWVNLSMKKVFTIWMTSRRPWVMMRCHIKVEWVRCPNSKKKVWVGCLARVKITYWITTRSLWCPEWVNKHLYQRWPTRPRL